MERRRLCQAGPGYIPDHLGTNRAAWCGVIQFIETIVLQLQHAVN